MELTNFINIINKSITSNEGKGYLVGGFIRDTLVKRSPKDIDIIIKGPKSAILPKIVSSTGVTNIFNDSRNDITKLTLSEPLADTQISEIDIKFIEGEINANLSLRDFSINAMALDLSHYSTNYSHQDLIDPFAGIKDIQTKTIRIINTSAFVDNPIRLLRAIRLASSLRFNIHPQTARQIKQDSHLILSIPQEGVGIEFLQILSNNNAKTHIEILDRLSLLEHVIPELALTKGVTQPKEHYWDVWNHNLHCLDHAAKLMLGHQNSPIYSMSPWTKELEDHFNQLFSTTHTRGTHLKLASLLHDIAKPNTKTVEDSGRTRFPDHEHVGADMSSVILKRLKMETVTINYVSTLITHHLRPHHMQQGVLEPTRKAIYRYFNELKSEGTDVLFLHLADYLSAKGPQLTISDWATRAKMMSHVIDTHSEQVSEVYKTPMLINGNDLMTEFNIEPGPVLGRLLADINEQHALGNVNTTSEAIDHARQILNTIQGQQ